jgi:hypothetical protein
MPLRALSRRAVKPIVQYGMLEAAYKTKRTERPNIDFGPRIVAQSADGFSPAGRAYGSPHGSRQLRESAGQQFRNNYSVC